MPLGLMSGEAEAADPLVGHFYFKHKYMWNKWLFI
jgi:hypothetical protein